MSTADTSAHSTHGLGRIGIWLMELRFGDPGESIAAWGSLEQITARVNEQLAAGADHVCLQVIGAEEPRIAWRRLAEALLLA